MVGKTALITGQQLRGIVLETLRVWFSGGRACLRSRGRNTEAKPRKHGVSVMKPGVRGSATPFACEQSQLSPWCLAQMPIAVFGCAIDMMICNAGLQCTQLEQVNGIEMHFAVQKHLSHFILVNRLLQNVKMPSPRSGRHGRLLHLYLDTHQAGIDLQNLSGERGPYRWDLMYGQSKLANGLFARELTHRLCDTR